jgi:hypothetical protein
MRHRCRVAARACNWDLVAGDRAENHGPPALLDPARPRPTRVRTRLTLRTLNYSTLSVKLVDNLDGDPGCQG